MKINRLVLNNFSSYEDRNEFDFSIKDKDKNIILVGGQNGAGKTSLFSAIKIGLYGPLAFGYRGINPHYIQKIKEYINTNAFQKKTVEAGVVIDVSIMVEREIANYCIKRLWSYKKQHLEELYEVEKNGLKLNDDELNYFENYLQTIIPPGLFDFFLFDGEEVGNIFSTNSYNEYIKKALFTLCGLDVFETIRKYSANYLVKSDESDEKEAIEIYNKNRNRIEEIRSKLKSDKIELENIERELSDENIKLQELEESFKRAGGITEAEKKVILDNISENEKRKSELNAKIKGFVEGIMPFVIAGDIANPILAQLNLEEQSERFQYIVSNVKKASVKQVLDNYNIQNGDIANELYDTIIEQFRPEGYAGDEVIIHDLSKEQKNRVYVVTDAVEKFDKDNMLDCIDEKNIVTAKLVRDKEALKNAMSEEDTHEFSESENRVLRHLAELKYKYEIIRRKIEEQEIELHKAQDYQEKCYQEIIEKAQNRNIYKYTSGISKVMTKVLDDRSKQIKQNLETLTVKNLSYIYRKNNLITHIEIDSKFKFNLYRNEVYTPASLLLLMKNYGNEEFSSLIGEKGIDILYKHFTVDSLVELKRVLEEQEDDKQIKLYERVELSKISKGERQIFILSLYWAIIKISGQKIPFIIDTPYARIDARHRKAISQIFFPNISEQVIILSTDEEINEEYYRIIKPFVEKEYLLLNDENDNRTTILDKYFYEV